MNVKSEAEAAAMTERVAMEALADVARGTAYVSSVEVDGEQSVVRLAYPYGRSVDAILSVVPAADPAVALERPLAVQVDGCSTGLACSVLDRASAGPTRVGITLAHALALASAGVHTVFQTH